MVKDIILGIFIILIYLLNYFLWGTFCAHCFKKKNESLFFILPSGFFIQAIVFFIVIFPLKLIGKSLSFAAYTWLIVWIICTITILLICRSDIQFTIKRIKEKLCYVHLIWFLITIVQLIYEAVFGRYTNGGGGVFYNSYVATEVFTNTLDVYNATTGQKLISHTEVYFLQTYLEHSAVVCKLTGITPIMESRTIMSLIVVLLSSMAIWALGKTIFNDSKHTLYFWLIYEAALGIMAQCVYIPAYHLYYRAFEGKAIFSNIMMPLVLLLFWKMYDEIADKYILFNTIFILTGSITFCMATMYIIPFLLLGYFPICIIKKSKQQFINWLLCWIPCILAAIYYIGLRLYIIDLTIK